MRKPRPKKIKWLRLSLIAIKWQRPILNPGSLAPEPTFLTSFIISHVIFTI